MYYVVVYILLFVVYKNVDGNFKICIIKDRVLFQFKVKYQKLFILKFINDLQMKIVYDRVMIFIYKEFLIN